MKGGPIGTQTSLTFVASFLIRFVTAITQVIIAYLYLVEARKHRERRANFND